MKELNVAVPGAARPYLIALPSDPDGVLDALDGSAQDEPHMPYWATPWPSGLALAEVCLSKRARLAGRGVLELGCGLGITAAAVLEACADLTAADCFAETLAYTRLNALRNAGREPQTLLADWRTEAGRSVLLRIQCEVALAADVLYEAEDEAPLLALGGALLARGTAFWLAEPGRATSRRFVAAARGQGWPGETIELERVWPAGAGPARVSVHLFEPRLR